MHGEDGQRGRRSRSRPAGSARPGPAARPCRGWPGRRCPSRACGAVLPPDRRHRGHRDRDRHRRLAPGQAAPGAPAAAARPRPRAARPRPRPPRRAGGSRPRLASVWISPATGMITAIAPIMRGQPGLGGIPHHLVMAHHGGFPRRESERGTGRVGLPGRGPGQDDHGALSRRRPHEAWPPQSATRSAMDRRRPSRAGRRRRGRTRSPGPARSPALRPGRPPRPGDGLTSTQASAVPACAATFDSASGWRSTRAVTTGGRDGGYAAGRP